MAQQQHTQIIDFENKFVSIVDECYKKSFNTDCNMEKLHTLVDTNQIDEPSKDYLYSYQELGKNDRNSIFVRKFYEWVDTDPTFHTVYNEFIQTEVFKLFPDEQFLLVQTTPNIRVGIPNTGAIGHSSIDPPNIIGLHKDADFGHHRIETNIIVPLTDMFGTNSVYYEPMPYSNIPVEKFTNLELKSNQYFVGYLNQMLHYNCANITGQTRISMDMRVIPYSKYLENKSDFIGTKFDIDNPSIRPYYTKYENQPNTNKITVIGIGRLGLGFALLLEKSGYDVKGVDIFEDYVANLNNKTIKFEEPGYNELLNSSKNFKATTSVDEGVNHSDTIFVIVQTPNGGGKNFYDHNILSNLLIKLNKHPNMKNKHVIIGCTVMPGYIEKIGNMLFQDGLKNGCILSYNPEFVAQGDIVNGFEHPDIILFGTDIITRHKIEPTIREIYTRMASNEPIFCFMNQTDAEIVKIALNSFITTKIAFANMVSELCTKMGASASTVLHAVGSDTRIGTKYFRPGHSYGGPCFPRDTKAFAQVLTQQNIECPLLEGTIRNNELHVEFEADQMMEQFKDADQIIFDNICYKPGAKIPIIEESARLKIAEICAKKNPTKKIIIEDVPALVREAKKEYGNLFTYREK